MPGDIYAMVAWFSLRIGGPKYSMNTTLRKGPDYYDCSNTLFNALIAGGFFPSGTYPGNTGTLKTLLPTMATQVNCSEAQYGDIFLSKPPAPKVGHTGVYVSNTEIIHMNYTDNGIKVTPAAGRRGYEPITCWRLTGVEGEPGDWEDVPGDNHDFDPKYMKSYLISEHRFFNRRRIK